MSTYQTTPTFKTLKQVESEHILKALDLTQGHITLAAKKLGISKSTMYRKLKQKIYVGRMVWSGNEET